MNNMGGWILALVIVFGILLFVICYFWSWAETKRSQKNAEMLRRSGEEVPDLSGMAANQADDDAYYAVINESSENWM